MSLKMQKILGISITIDSEEKILEEIQKGLEKLTKNRPNPGKNRPKIIVISTPNPEQVVYARQHPWFAKMLNEADVTLPDGIGLVFAARFLPGLAQIARISGVDFLDKLAGMAANKGYRVGLIGSKPSVALSALDCLRHKHPGLTGWAVVGPDVQIESANLTIPPPGYFSDLAQELRKTNARMIFVGLGAPKQELFIRELKARLTTLDLPHPLVLMSVGGSFDILSGRIRRAPAFLRTLGLEWLWRLLSEPWRIRRQLALFEFLWLLVVERLSGRPS